MKKYASIPEFYADLSASQRTLAKPIIKALEWFGVGKLQWNMPVYYKDNIIIRPKKNQSRWYFGIKGAACKHPLMYLWFYDIHHFMTQQPQVEYAFDQIQKITGQIWIRTEEDSKRAAALITLSKDL